MSALKASKVECIKVDSYFLPQPTVCKCSFGDFYELPDGRVLNASHYPTHTVSNDICYMDTDTYLRRLGK